MSNPYPLAVYDGKLPPSPDWFRKFIETPCTSHIVNVDGANISYQQWGNPNNPGLLFVHGNGAHVHWYDFIAPAFADDFNVVAFDLSGMGNSDWRDRYSIDQFSAEQIAVMKDAGMFDHEIKPIITAHSFGGIPTLTTADQYGHLLKGVAIIDSTVFPPEEADAHPKPPPSSKQAFFPDLQSALARFRLMPPQNCKNHFILDHIARNSLKKVERDGNTGWSWKFDPSLWGKMAWDDAEAWEALRGVSCPISFIRGEHSNLLSEEIRDTMLSQKQMPFLTIKDAGHHVFLDKPLETIATLKEFFSSWDELAP